MAPVREAQWQKGQVSALFKKGEFLTGDGTVPLPDEDEIARLTAMIRPHTTPMAVRCGKCGRMVVKRLTPEANPLPAFRVGANNRTTEELRRKFPDTKATVTIRDHGDYADTAWRMTFSCPGRAGRPCSVRKTVTMARLVPAYVAAVEAGRREMMIGARGEDF